MPPLCSRITSLSLNFAPFVGSIQSFLITWNTRKIQRVLPALSDEVFHQAYEGVAGSQTFSKHSSVTTWPEVFRNTQGTEFPKMSCDTAHIYRALFAISDFPLPSSGNGVHLTGSNFFDFRGCPLMGQRTSESGGFELTNVLPEACNREYRLKW